MNELKEAFMAFQRKVDAAPVGELLLSTDHSRHVDERLKEMLDEAASELPAETARRLHNEYLSYGPLEPLLEDETITEILVNGREHIWYEKSGRLYRHEDQFCSPITFRNITERICQAAGIQISVEHPCADGKFGDFRVSLIGAELTRSQTHMTLRRHPKNPWTFQRLAEEGWCGDKDVSLLKEILSEKKNFLIIGSTGSGKTSVLNSFLNLLPSDERVVSIEDTPEIALPNSSCMKLLTRDDAHGLLPEVDQTQLVKRALRLRPDRIVMGEVRGAEAKDFLMALATGHQGSFGTLHAQDAHQALIRLEMLIQMGAPQWSLSAVRRLIQLSLDYIIITARTATGERRFQGAYRLSSLEEHGFLVERVESA